VEIFQFIFGTLLPAIQAIYKLLMWLQGIFGNPLM